MKVRREVRFGQTDGRWSTSWEPGRGALLNGRNVERRKVSGGRR